MSGRGYRDWAEAFGIFAKTSQDFDPVICERGMIYAGQPSLTSERDAMRLLELGWLPHKTRDMFWHFLQEG